MYVRCNQAGYYYPTKVFYSFFFLRFAVINFGIIGSYFHFPSRTLIIDTLLYVVINDWLIDALDIYSTNTTANATH